jgi:hypothetical protein
MANYQAIGVQAYPNNNPYNRDNSDSDDNKSDDSDDSDSNESNDNKVNAREVLNIHYEVLKMQYEERRAGRLHDLHEQHRADQERRADRQALLVALVVLFVAMIYLFIGGRRY